MQAESKSVAKKKHNIVEIESEEELPDGTHLYASKSIGDYREVKHYAEKPDARLLVTISEKGSIRDVTRVDG